MNIYNQIIYKQENIGYFPEFENILNHGFSWGKGSKNMSFSFGEEDEVRHDIQNFLDKMDMGSINNSFVIKPEHKDNIVMIDKEYKSSKLGIEIECDVLLTKRKNITLTLKPGDCTSAILYATDESDTPIIGLVHHGRRGVELELPIKVIRYLNNYYNVKNRDIKVSIVPHLFKENRKFENIDSLDKSIWKDYIIEKGGYFYPMETELALSQYLKVGVLNNNISIYNVDTYEAAKNKESFSYKYSLEMEKLGKEAKEGRFIVAVRLY